MLEQPEIDDLLTDDPAVVFLAGRLMRYLDRSQSQSLLKRSKTMEVRGSRRKGQEVMTSVPTRLIGVAIDTGEGVWMTVENG